MTGGIILCMQEVREASKKNLSHTNNKNKKK